MASWIEQHWAASFDAPTERDRRGGYFRAYDADLLVPRALSVGSALSEQAARAETAVRDLVNSAGAPGLEGLSRFLLRSEAIASSRIEGLQASPQQVALAELAITEAPGMRGFTENARLVANNILALRRATTDLAMSPRVDVEGMSSLHRALLPNEDAGLRDVQNWIAGSDWHPLDAEFVPPPPDRVPRLMADLADYATGAVHAPLIQAALVHAQFETIHPYRDGNGRVGRALIHTVLTRRRLTRTSLLPVSMILLTHSREYVDGLTAFRYSGSATDPAAIDGVAKWLAVFLAAVEQATHQARDFVVQLDSLSLDWDQRNAQARSQQGVRDKPRASSSVARLLDLLPEAPVLTARTVERLLGVTAPAARGALEELAEAGILHRKRVERGTIGYLAREVFDLLTFAERRLASTHWDTRQSPPARPVPANPQRG